MCNCKFDDSASEVEIGASEGVNDEGDQSVSGDATTSDESAVAWRNADKHSKMKSCGVSVKINGNPDGEATADNFRATKVKNAGPRAVMCENSEMFFCIALTRAASASSAVPDATMDVTVAATRESLDTPLRRGGGVH